MGDGINHPLSQQVKMDEIAKDMIPNAHSEERNPKVQIFTRENTDRVYILTHKCYRVWHTHL